MNLIITKDPRVPKELESFDHEVWSINEFIRKANEGLRLSDNTALYFNLDILSKELYEAVRPYASQFTLVYYKFKDQDINLDFTIHEDLVIFDDPTRVQEEKEEEKEEKTEEVKEEPKEKEEPKKEEPKVEDIPDDSTAVLDVITQEDTVETEGINRDSLLNLLKFDEVSTMTKKSDKPAKVILFGSSKGGTGKTTTCMMSVYRYAQTHPDEKIAIADFDIIDGQVGIVVGKVSPTMGNYYNAYTKNRRTIKDLNEVAIKHEKYGSNVDIYLAPPIDRPEITENEDFWNNIFTLLITHYDTVFFDTGIDYLGKAPIRKIYKIADKIILTCNPSIASVKSVTKQLQNLSGKRPNGYFTPMDKILDRVSLVLTRVNPKDTTITGIVVDALSPMAPIVAAFSNIDDIISRLQWYQDYDLLNAQPNILKTLDKITDFGGGK